MSKETLIILGDYLWDIEEQSLSYISTDQSITSEVKRLTNKQQLLLCQLYDAYPHCLTKEQLITAIWNSNISPESLPQLINRTRKTLNDKDKDIIKYRSNVGYSLTIKQADCFQMKESQVVADSFFVSLFKRFCLLGVAVLTGFNIYNFYDAYTDKEEYINLRFYKPYPRIEETDEPDELMLKVGSNECIYERENKTLICQ
ncbi:hypothetical protein C0W44_08610 [Photobacterium leiognathi subsp. mandapamensis]|nr:hypothetical protein C0W44_08610 [Photobacterium leiognathi subsp. mandapamensis]